MDGKSTERAKLLFEIYPKIQKAYDLTQDLRTIFEKTTDKYWDLQNWSNGRRK